MITVAAGHPRLNQWPIAQPSEKKFWGWVFTDLALEGLTFCFLNLCLGKIETSIMNIQIVSSRNWAKRRRPKRTTTICSQRTVSEYYIIMIITTKFIQQIVNNYLLNKLRHNILYNVIYMSVPGVDVRVW